MERISANPLVIRALEVAEKRIGMKALSERLGSPAGSIEAWRHGKATMPEDKFLALVDLLTEIAVDWDEWNPKQ